MPTIPLYTSPTDPDQSHNVRTPGGYEWWYFDAENPGSDRQIVVMFFEGCPFDPRYVREYHRYIRNPTRVRPPLPAGFPCTYFAMHQAGKLVAQFIDHSSARPIVHRGEQQIFFAHDLVEVQLTFRPRWSHPAFETTLLDHHHWVLVEPLCDVAGTIRLNRDSIPFSGRGYRDHRWGTAAPSTTTRKWIFGRVLREDSVLAFEVLKSRRNGSESATVEVDEAGIRESPGGDVGTVLPDSAEMIDRSLFHRRFKHGSMLLHVVHPNRLAWPFVSQVIEGKMFPGLRKISRAPSS